MINIPVDDTESVLPKIKTKSLTYREYNWSRDMPNINIPRYSMLKSSELLVLYVFIICGTALAHTTNDPVVPNVSNINFVSIDFTSDFNKSMYYSIFKITSVKVVTSPENTVEIQTPRTSHFFINIFFLENWKHYKALQSFINIYRIIGNY